MATKETSGPAELVAIARAAHLCGDRELKRVAIRELKQRFGITIRFAPIVRREMPRHG